MITIGLIIVLAVAIAALMQANGARNGSDQLRGRFNEHVTRYVERTNELTQRVKVLEEQVTALRYGAPPATVKPAEAAQSHESSAASEAPPQPFSLGAMEDPMLAEEVSKSKAVLPVLAQANARAPHQLPPPLPTFASAATHVEQAQPAKPSQPSIVPKQSPNMNLEQFIGANLMAWAAGLAAFIGVVLFVKYAFEKNLIPPAMRTAMGFLTGMGLVTAGLRLHGNQRFAVMSQALAATGVLVLYGVTFAAHSLYHFPMFNSGVTFVVMSLITAVAFLMAVRMDAQVVAVLGMLGGFLTPILCATGEDNPFGLFTYIALLDVGLLAVVRHKRWFHLVPLAALGTAVMQAGWATEFFRSEHYDTGAKTWIVVLVFAAFAWLFTAASRWINKLDESEIKVAASALALAFVGMFAAFCLMKSEVVAMRPVVLYSLVMLVNAAALWILWMHRPLAWAHALIGALTFLHLGVWTGAHLTTELLPITLTIYLLFGATHTAFSVFNVRKHGPSPAASWTPVITLVLMMLPLLKLEVVPFLVWPALMLVNLFVIGLALITRNVWPVLASLLLTLLAALLWLGKLPTTAMSLLPFLAVVGVFAALFIAASFFLAKRLPNLLDGLVTNIMPTASAVLPFGLLIIATLRLPIANPAPVFGFALALAVFLLVLARIATHPVLVGAAVVCVLGLEAVWHQAHFSSEHPLLALPWYLGFLALFTVYPMIVHPKWTRDVTVWIGSVIASLGTFALVHWLVKKTWPNEVMGLIPAAFVLPSLTSLIWVRRRHPADSQVRVNQLAWLGGATLFFITLIFPIQFDKQWLTIAWALEGAALCWLFQRVPHRGLLQVACGLISVAFVRLALNPAVLNYHQRSGAMIFNWFLYTYAIAAGAIFAAAWLVKRDERVGEINLRGLFCALGGVLVFLLMNIEIADAFSSPGEHFLTFDFSGNLARDMTYTISWAGFALSLLIIGFNVRARFTRYAGIGLMGVALLKLFFHDLAGIDGIYRIGALLVVAVLGFAASYLYQRFADRDNS